MVEHYVYKSNKYSYLRDGGSMHAAGRSPTGHCGTAYLHGMDSLARSRRCREPRGGLGRGWAGEHPISSHSPRPGPPLTGQDPGGGSGSARLVRVFIATDAPAPPPLASGESDVSAQAGWPTPAPRYMRHRGPV